MMNLDEIRANHRALSAADWRFRELAMSDPRYQRRESFHLDEPNDLLMFRMQAWPTFLGREKVAELARISTTLSGLIRSIPRRVFRDDVDAISRFYGIGDPLLTALLLDVPNGVDIALSRGDFIFSRAGFQCIEFNLAAGLGGWETSIVSLMQLANPIITEALERLGIEVSFAYTSRVMLEHVCAEIERLGIDGDPHVVLIADIEGEERRRRAEALRRYLEDELSAVLAGSARRGRVFVCRFSDLESDGRLGLRVAGVSAHAIVDINNSPPDRRVFRAFKARAIALFNGPMCRMLSDKRNIGLLSDESLDAGLSAEERSFLGRYVPWTRVMRREKTTYQGSEVFLPELVKAERERLVLKNAQLSGGQEVFVGRDTSAASWDQALDKALQGNWVVQEFTPSRPLLYQSGAEGFVPHSVVWGPFVFGERYAGTMLRLQPAEGTAVINLSQTAEEGIVFEVDREVSPV